MSADDAWAPPAVAVTPTPPASVEVPGYADLRPLARGGSSDVFSAVQATTRRPVAIKVVHLRDAEAIRHFERELEITVRLGRQHPNIVTVLDTAFTTEGLPCLVMELADLGSVDARLRELGPLPAGDVVALGTVIADALAFAHQQGVLHRDVKPPNILVLPTSYVLSDFGIARALDAGHSASMELFSYRHAAPQVLDGEMPSAADDVYSLGSTMFTLLSGRAPFAGETPDEDSALAYLRRARTTEAPPLTRPDLPPTLGGVIARCLTRERSDRPTAAELHRLLQVIPTEQRGWAGRVAAEAPPAEPAFDPTEPAALAVAPEFAPVDAPAVPAEPAPPLQTPAPPRPSAPPPTASAPPPYDEAPPPPTASAYDAAPPPPYDEAPPPMTAFDAQPPHPAPALSPEREALLLATAATYGIPNDAALPERTVGMRAAPPPAAPPPPAKKRGWLPWAAAFLVLVAGGVAALARFHGGSTEDAGHAAPLTSGTPSFVVTPKAAPTSSTLQRSSPAASGAPPVMPKLISARPDGSKVRLHWSDPSGGTDTFVVVQVFGATYATFPDIPRGTTQISVTPSPGSPLCFQVIAINSVGNATSNSACAS